MKREHDIEWYHTLVIMLHWCSAHLVIMLSVTTIYYDLWMKPDTHTFQPITMRTFIHLNCHDYVTQLMPNPQVPLEMSSHSVFRSTRQTDFRLCLQFDEILNFFSVKWEKRIITLLFRMISVYHGFVRGLISSLLVRCAHSFRDDQSPHSALINLISCSNECNNPLI